MTLRRQRSGVRIPSGAPINNINDLEGHLAALAAAISGSQLDQKEKRKNAGLRQWRSRADELPPFMRNRAALIAS
jgi:hypothetical protein